MPSHRPRLSVAMIVRDEEAQLPRALESVRGIADQILVADTGSQDQSCRVALQHGAHVVSVPWSDDFSAARNRCLDYLTGDWVLWLDASEQLSPRCCASLREFVDGQPDANEAWLLMVEQPPEGPSATAERVGRIRLVPRRDDLRFTGRVRESMRPAIEASGMTIKIGPWRILRSARDLLPEVKRARALRDLRLIELEVQQSGPGPRLLVALGDACTTLGDPNKAMTYYRQAILQSPRGSTEMLSSYYGLLTAFPADGSAGNGPLETCIEALEVYPYDAQLLCAMGSYLQAQGHHSLAQRSYRAAHEFGHVDPEAWHVSCIGEVAAECLSLNLQLLSDDAAALKVLEEAEARYPRSERLARRRMELHVKLGQPKEAAAEIDKLGEDCPHKPALRTAVQGAIFAHQKNWAVALPYLEMAYAEGCRDPLCLRWYTATLFANGNQSRAGEVLQAWSQVEPGCSEVARYRAALAESPATSDAPMARHGGHGVAPPLHWQNAEVPRATL